MLTVKHIVLLAILLLAACGSPPAPTAGTEVPGSSPASPAPTVSQEAAVTPSPAAVLRPTEEPTAQPTASAPNRPAGTPAATLGATAPATSRPTATSTARPTDSPAAVATPLPTAALSASALLASARWHQLIGDCDQARRELAELLRGSPDPAEAAEARYRMAQCYVRDDAPAEAMVTLAELLAKAAEADPYRAPATFNLGETLLALGRWSDAEAAYQDYLKLAPSMAYLTWQRIGAARRSVGDLPGATAAYKSALATSPDWTNTVAIRRALADLALAQDSPREAAAQYDALAGKETTGPWVAEMRYRAGMALALAAPPASQTPAPQATRPPPAAEATATGAAPTAAPTVVVVPAEALARWQAAVDADVTSPYAHAAIVALLDAGAPVDEYQRGRANYHKGNYELAIAAFDRLRAAEPAGRDGAALYYTGLSRLALGETDRGLAALDQFIAGHPNSPLWAEAWMAKARTQARAGQTGAAQVTYRRLAELRPDAPQAPKALWQAALLQGQPGPSADAAAAEAYLALGRRYPAADEGWRAYQAAGLSYFRLADWPRAAVAWREMAENAGLPAWTRPVAYYWLGRAQLAEGDRAAALRSWRAAQQAAPEDFYARRAAAWAAGEVADAASPPAGQTPATADAAGTTPTEAAEIAAWLRAWAGEGTLELPAAVRADPDWQRGGTLLELGRRPEALANWGRVQQRYAGNPWTLAALALAFQEAGAHRLSLISAQQVLDRWGRDTADAPEALQRLAYPFPYGALIRAEAAARGLDPRLLAAVIRQESRFETGAISSAGAQGLMQVMPATAKSIAGQLGWHDFQPQQAYWPYVNAAFGAFYIDQWLEHFGGSVFTALAAYNGGPGNASVWHGWAPEDPDLMAALININETRVYIQAVWENYEAYKRLYPR